MQRNLFSRFFMLLLALAVGIAPATAAEKKNYIRDAEIEALLQDLGRPIFQAAGLDPNGVEFALIQDPAINAFVAGGMNMFFFTGLLRATKTPEELIGIIAHETGHISGGHLVRTGEAMAGASATAIIATIVGLAAAVGSGQGAAGAAAVSAGQQIAQRQFLQYSRTQESAADQAGLSYLLKAGITAVGMRDFLKRLENQELVPESQQVEYVRTHPLTRDRVEAVSAFVSATTAPVAPLSADFHKRFERMQAKLDGFLDPRGTLRKYTASEKSFNGRYALAIATHLTGDTVAAIKLIDSLLQDEPRNAYLHELKGQILFESGQAQNAAGPYGEAVQLAPDSALLRIGYAQTLLALNTPAGLASAMRQLEVVLTTEKRWPLLWRLLATAHGRSGNMGMAAYALAEEALAKGDKALARQQATKAQELLPKGSAGWLKADDVLTAAVKKKD